MAERDARRDAQEQAVRNELLRGARVESQTDYQAVLVVGRPVNHILHFLIGALTCGVWWLVWLYLAVTGGERRFIVETDEQAHSTIAPMLYEQSGRQVTAMRTWNIPAKNIAIIAGAVFGGLLVLLILVAILSAVVGGIST